MRSEREMYDLILDYAWNDPKVRGVILNGSRANPAGSLDRFRDFDIVFLVTDVQPYKQGDISPSFGEMLVMQRTDENELFDEHFPHLAVYLMQFADGNRIDLTIARKEDFHGFCFDDRLSVVLLDKDGFLPALPSPDESTHGITCPNARIFQECRNEFWWTALYVSKGIWRGQLLYAQQHLENCSRKMLRLMLSWQIGAEQGFPVYPGKAGDRLQRYLPPETWEHYLSTYSDCRKESLFTALGAACRLFTEATSKAAEAFGYTYEDTWDKSVPEFIWETQKRIASLPDDPSWDGEMSRQIKIYKGRKEHES